MAHRLAQKDSGQIAVGNNEAQTQMDSGHFQTHSVSLQLAERSEPPRHYKWQRHHGT